MWLPAARPNTPGVYARVGDAELRSFVERYLAETGDERPVSEGVEVVAVTTETMTDTTARTTVEWAHEGGLDA